MHGPGAMAKPGRPPRPPSHWTKQTTARLDDVLLRALSQAPDKRQASAVVSRNELADALGNPTEVDPAGPAFVSLPRRAARILGHAALQAATLPVRMLATPRRSAVVAAGAVALSLVVLGPHIVDSVRRSGNANQGLPAQRLPEAAPVVDPIEKETLVAFHTWPPSAVYIDGSWIVEAPSPEQFPLKPGQHALRLVPKTGMPRDFRLTIESAGRCRLKINLDTDKAELERVGEP